MVLALVVTCSAIGLAGIASIPRIPSESSHSLVALDVRAVPVGAGVLHGIDFRFQYNISTSDNGPTTIVVESSLWGFSNVSGCGRPSCEGTVSLFNSSQWGAVAAGRNVTPLICATTWDPTSGSQCPLVENTTYSNFGLGGGDPWLAPASTVPWVYGVVWSPDPATISADLTFHWETA